MKVREAGEDIGEIYDALISTIPEANNTEGEQLHSELDDDNRRPPEDLKTDDNIDVVSNDIDDSTRRPEDLKTVVNIDENTIHVGHYDVADDHFTQLNNYRVQIPRNKTKNTPPTFPNLCNSTTKTLTNYSSLGASFVAPPTPFVAPPTTAEKLFPVFTKGIPERKETKIINDEQRRMNKKQTTNDEQQKQNKISKTKQKLNVENKMCFKFDEKLTETDDSVVVNKETYITDIEGKLAVKSESCASPILDYNELGAKPKDKSKLLIRQGESVELDLLYEQRSTDRDISTAKSANDEMVPECLEVEPVFPPDIGKFPRQNSNFVRDLGLVSEKRALQKIALTPPPRRNLISIL